MMRALLLAPGPSSTLFSAILLAILLPLPLRADPPAEDPPTEAGPAVSDDERALRELNARWLSAYVDKDVAALDGILAENFVQYRAQTGERTDKAAFLAGIRDGRATVESVDCDELWVQVDGDTALVTGRSRLVRRGVDGERVRLINRYLDVYVKRDGRWRAVAAKVTRVGEEKL